MCQKVDKKPGNRVSREPFLGIGLYFLLKKLIRIMDPSLFHPSLFIPDLYFHCHLLP
jgi:hypothetical protein